MIRRGPLLLLVTALVVLSGGITRVVVAQSGTKTPAGFVVRDGDHLVRDGKTFRFAGVNAYQLATNYQLDQGCGPQPSSPDQLLSTLVPGSVVRFWAFEKFATNPQGARDWRGLDAVVRTAERRGVLLDITLSDQAGTCDGSQWHDDAWYRSGYRATFEPWLRAIVSRYATSPAVAMWEAVNEAEPSNCDAGYSGAACIGHNPCPDDATRTLRSFFDATGAEIHRLDRWHPVAEGIIGGEQCGARGTGFATLAASPGLDVLTVHNYTVGGDESWVTKRAQLAKAAGKPLVDEETGLPAGTGSCPTVAQRVTTLGGSIDRFLALPGAAGALAWSWWTGPVQPCDLALVSDDPMLGRLADLERDLTSAA